ncbi:MAG: helix-turn-helix domain-containing protein [Thermodesulfobacteriota bacterium]
MGTVQAQRLIKDWKNKALQRHRGLLNPKNTPKVPLRKRLLTVQEASVYLGRSIPSIRELIWAGSLPIIKVGKRIHLDIFDLDKWIEQHKIRYTY